MYKISIYGCAMFKKLVCQWVNTETDAFRTTGRPVSRWKWSPEVFSGQYHHMVQATIVIIDIVGFLKWKCAWTT